MDDHGESGMKKASCDRGRENYYDHGGHGRENVRGYDGEHDQMR
jgi:hypothetical protein